METKIFFVLIGMSIVTQLPRIFPLVILSKFNLPPLLMRWLRHIPIAVLSALLVPAILLQSGDLNVSLHNKSLLASIPCLIVAAKTKNLFLTVFTGIFIMFLLQIIQGAV